MPDQEASPKVNQTQLLITDLKGSLAPGEGYNLISQDNVFFPDQDPKDVDAVKIVVQDVEKAEGWLNSKMYIKDWNLADMVFHAIVDPQRWPGTEVDRSHLGMPLLQEHLFTLMSTVQESLFNGVTFVKIDPASTETTSATTARANQALIDWEWLQCGPKGGSGKAEVMMIVFDALLYGTGFGMWGFDTRIKKRKMKRYKKNAQAIVSTGGNVVTLHPSDEDMENFVEEKHINLPKFEYVNIRYALIDPGCRRGDVRFAKWFARRIYLNAVEMDELRDVEGFQNIPTRAQLILLTTPSKQPTSMNPMETQSVDWGLNRTKKALPRWMPSTSDPLRQDYEVLEYWTDTHVFHVLEKQLLIRKQAHNFGVIPAVSVCFHTAPDSLYGSGLYNIIGNYQRVMQGVVNLYLDDAALNLNGMSVNKRGSNQMPQAIWASPGKVINVEDPDSFKPFPRQPVGPDALGIIASCRDWAQRTSGASEIASGGQLPSRGGSSITRSATGAGIIGGAAAQVNQRFIDDIADQILIPVVQAFIDLNFDHLSPTQIKQILSQELGHAYSDDPINILNGQYKVTISAGSRLQARNALNASLPSIIQMVTATTMTQGLQIEHKKINYTALFNQIYDAVGYPGRADVIQDMTPDDVKQMAQSNPAMQQKAIQDQKIQGEADQQLRIEEAKTGGRALITTLKHTMEKEDEQAAGGAL